jgi:hypothetical protein
VTNRAICVPCRVFLSHRLGLVCHFIGCVVGPESQSVSDEILDDAGEFYGPVLGDERVVHVRQAVPLVVDRRL